MVEEELEKKLKEYQKQKWEELKRKLFKEAGVRNLITGIISLFVAIVFIIWVYSYLTGMVSGGGDLIMKREGIIGLLYFGFGILFFGLLGGFEIGRYVEMEFSKRRIARTKTETLPPPPPSK